MTGAAPTLLKTGARLRSQVDETQVVVVRSSAVPVALTIGGAPAIDLSQEPDPGLALDPRQAGGALLGKRYTDDGGTLELLVTRGGEGTLCLDGEPLTVKTSKPLPASD